MFDQISEVDWARASAYVDGEGSILIVRRGTKRYDFGKGYYLDVRMTNTDPRLIVWFAERFGGSVIREKRKSNKHRDCYRWHVTCQTAARFLEGCLPYSILKREQIEKALAFQSTLRGAGTKVSEESARARELYKQELSDLKWVKHDDSVLAPFVN